MKFDGIVLQVNTHRLTQLDRIFDLTSHFQDGGYNDISRNKVLPPAG